MRTGASGVCSMGGLTAECNSAELRFWRGDEQIFKNNISACIANDIYMICNLDFHKDIHGGHYPFDPNRINDMMTIMAEAGCIKSNSRITVENEPMKYWSKEQYADMVRQTYDSVAGRWLVGAGNEEFGLAEARGNMYYYILENCQFDYLDIHIQSTMIGTDWRVDKDRVRYWLNQARVWATTYNKKMSCTEANWSKIETAVGHADLMWEREQALAYGLEDFNIVFIDGLTTTKHWLDYQIRGNQNSIYYPDLKQRMIDEKEIIIPEEEDMKLEVLKIGSTGNQVQWLQEILEIEYGYENELHDGIFGNLTDEQVKEYQENFHLVVDGYVGKNTMTKLINEAETPDDWDRQLKIYMAYE